MPLPPSAVVLIQTHNREVDYVDGGVTYYKTFGLFKDDAGTDPVTEEGDEIAVSKDFDGAIQTLQPVSAKRGIMLYADAQPGVPCYDGDGGDDWAPWTAGVVGGQVTYSALWRSKTPIWNSFWSPIETTVESDIEDRWGTLKSTTTEWESDGGPGRIQAVNKNGVSLSSPFDCAPINNWFVSTQTTFNANLAQRGIGQTETRFYGNFQLIALIMHDPADTAEVQAYLQTLKPGNVTPLPSPSGNATLRFGYGGYHGMRIKYASITPPVIESVVVEGAGNSTINGTYTGRGTFNGKNYYNLVSFPDSNSNRVIYWSGLVWFISDSGGSQIYVGVSPSEFPWETAYLDFQGGTNDPPPTVTEG